MTGRKGRPKLSPICEDCEAETVSQKVWQSMSIEERKLSGKKRGTGLYCVNCDALRRRGTVQKRWELPVLIEEAELLFASGLAAAEVAKQLGIKHGSLIQAYYRGRRKGLTTRKPDYRGTRELHNRRRH